MTRVQGGVIAQEPPVAPAEPAFLEPQVRRVGAGGADDRYAASRQKGE